jgi:hypothetical protein
LFRSHGHSKGACGEVFIILSFAAYFGFYLYWFVFRPSLLFKLNTSSYECNENDKNLFRALVDWMFVAYPLVLQIVYFCLTHKMSQLVSDFNEEASKY